MNEAFTPSGRPVAAKVTLPVNPGWPVTVTVDDPAAPWLTASDAGAALNVKTLVSIVRPMPVVATRPPEEPAMVTRNVPTTAELLAVNATVLDPVVGFGVNDAVTPPGRPYAARFTLPMNPGWPATVMVAVPEDPCITAREAGEAERAKPGAGSTFRKRVATEVRPPEVPLICTMLPAPTAAGALAERVSTLVAAVGLGLNDAVTPLGK